MKTIPLVCMTALLGLSLAGAATAQDVRQPSGQPGSTRQATDVPPAGQDPALQDDGGHENFTDADLDGDGVLSLTEVQAALPHFLVEDSDADGMLSQAEAEAALPELAFEERGRDGGDAPIGETEFSMIVMALNERREDDFPNNPQ